MSAFHSRGGYVGFEFVGSIDSAPGFSHSGSLFDSSVAGAGFSSQNTLLIAFSSGMPFETGLFFSPRSFGSLSWSSPGNQSVLCSKHRFPAWASTFTSRRVIVWIRVRVGSVSGFRFSIFSVSLLLVWASPYLPRWKWVCAKVSFLSVSWVRLCLWTFLFPLRWAGCVHGPVLRVAISFPLL